MSLNVLWHHIGSEHGGLQYAKEIRKNAPEVIEQYLKAKEAWVRGKLSSQRFFRYDEKTLIEISDDQNSIII